MGPFIGIGIRIGDVGGVVGGGVDPPIITNQVINVLRSNIDASLGFRFTVGGANITVTALGRWIIAGNSQNHPVRLFDNTPTQLGTVTVNPASVPGGGGYAYATLGTPVVLLAGTTYAVLSDEISGLDQFNDTDVVTANASITVNESAFRAGLAGGAGLISAGAAGSRSYGPVNFRWH